MQARDVDKWTDWLLHGRFGGNRQAMDEIMAMLVPIRDHVLDLANLRQGITVLDVGTGDGLIAFGALKRVGEQGKVIFSDISPDLIKHSRRLATEMGLVPRCEFVIASAEDLSVIPSESVDAVTIRSVLIYVNNKEQALRECYRVLRPGGTLAFFEPINRFASQSAPTQFWGYDVTPIQDTAAKVRTLYEHLQPPDSDPMFNFDERDLLATIETVGFPQVHVQLDMQVEPMLAKNWEIFSKQAGNPNIPSLQEGMQQSLTAHEVDQFTSYLRPLVEQGIGIMRRATVYVCATKAAN